MEDLTFARDHKNITDALYIDFSITQFLMAI